MTLRGNANDIWTATFAAGMVRQIFDCLQRGDGAPDDGALAGFAEEAEGVADLVVEQYERREHEEYRCRLLEEERKRREHEAEAVNEEGRHADVQPIR